MITYRLRLEDGREHTFLIDPRGAPPPGPSRETPLPEWVRLETRQCSNCPLTPEDHPFCPAVLAVRGVAEQFGSNLSIMRVDVWVETRERSYFKNTDLQSCLRSIFGLAMATSGCPILSRLRPMAYFHLPFATLEETFFRVAGTYLLKQHLAARQGLFEPDWSLRGVEELYKEIETVNHHLIRRIRLASAEDANINAVQSYCSISTLVGMSMEEILKEFLPVLLEGL